MLRQFTFITIAFAVNFAGARTLFLAHYDDSPDGDFAMGAAVAESVPGFGAAKIAAEGRWQGALAIDNVDPGRCAYAALDNLDIRQGTVDFWYCFDEDETNVYHPLFGWYNMPGNLENGGFEAYTQNGAISFDVYSPSSLVQARYRVDTGKWHHLEINWDCTGGDGNSTYNVYVDGRQTIHVDNGKALKAPGGRLHVGIWSYGYGHCLRGRLDELRITDQIEHYANFSPPVAPHPTPGTAAGFTTAREQVADDLAALSQDVDHLRLASSQLVDGGDAAAAQIVTARRTAVTENKRALERIKSIADEGQLYEIADAIRRDRRAIVMALEGLYSRHRRFRNVTAEMKLEVSGAPAAWADVDGDGFADITMYSGSWRNEGGNGFSRQPKIPAGCMWGDYDNDGDLDGYTWLGNRVYQNMSTPGKVVFESDMLLPALPAGKDISNGTNRSANWADYNGDGFLDLFVTGYETGGMAPYNDTLMLSDNASSFTSQTIGGPANGRGVTSCDWDEDGDIDVYVTNYRLQPNRLWENDGRGNFSFIGTSHNALGGNGHGIGSCWGDIDNDGDFDLFVGNFAHGGQPQSRFLENLGPEHGYRFADRGTCGVGYQESYASPVLGDYDNDGDVDLFFTTVYGHNQPRLYRNDGRWSFTDVTAAEGLSNIGAGYLAAYADFDNDGDLDLLAGKALYRNQTVGNHWLRVRLEGSGKVNRSAIGAQVRIHLPDRTLTRQVEAGTGEGNQSELVLHFGLGRHRDPVELEISWPHNIGVQKVMTAVDRLVTVDLR